MVRIPPNQGLQTQRSGKLGFRVLEIQGDAGASVRNIRMLDRKFAFAVGLPVHSLLCREARSERLNFDSLGNDECGIETDTELSNQLSIFLLITGHLLEKFGSARFCDCAKVCNQFIPGHANTIVDDGNGFLFFVVLDTYPEIGIFLLQVRRGQRFEAKPVCRIRGV